MPRDEVPVPAVHSDALPSAATGNTSREVRLGQSGFSLRLRLMLMLLAVFGVIQVGLSVVYILNVRHTAAMLIERDPQAYGIISKLTESTTTQVVILTPIGLFAAAIAGWLIAGIAVRPLRQLGQIASQMRPDNLAQPIDFQSSARELTLLKQELDQMRRRIETGYEAQERFVANVSHELKTPIATVLTEAQTLARPEASPREVRQFVDSTQDEMRRLGRLVESFLMLTRVRHGKPLESTRTTIPVNDFVLDSLQHCWKFAEQHGVRLHAILAEETDRDLLIIGDPELLRTLVDNLLRNAIRFSPQGSRIDVVVRTDGPDKICICVQDKGPGIPQPLIERIFDRFAQGKGEEKLGRGSGLGLEIAQGIAELHGGRISASNLPDGGCEFCATLPLAEPAAPDAPTCSEAKSDRAQSDKSQSDKSQSDEAASPMK